MITGSYTYAGLDFPNVVAVFSKGSFDTKRKILSVKVEVWKDATAYQNGEAPLMAPIPSMNIENNVSTPEGTKDFFDDYFVKDDILKQKGIDAFEQMDKYAIEQNTPFNGWTIVSE